MSPMHARAGVVALFCLLPVALSGLVTAWLFGRPAPPVEIDFGAPYNQVLLTGFHVREERGGRGFRWTSGRPGIVTIQNLARGGRLRVELQLRGLRLKGAPSPQVRIKANGVTIFETLASDGLETYRFGLTLPETRLELAIESDTFRPADFGPLEDRRSLGVQVHSLRIEPRGGKREAFAPAGWMMLAAAFLLGSVLTAGASLPKASVLAAFGSLGFAYLLQWDVNRYLPYAKTVATLCGLTLVLTLVLRWVFSRAQWLRREYRPLLIAIVGGSFLLKMGILFFPIFVSSDGDFQAHRLSEMLQGNLFPTSVTQHDPPFQIPYPISLYAVAAPLVKLGLSRITALLTVTVIADVLVGLALAFVSSRFLDDPRAGALAAVLYQFVPLNFLAFSAGNWTNLFGVALMAIFLGLFLAAGSGLRKPLVLFGALLCSVLALTAHFGTLLFAVAFYPAVVAGIYWLSPRQIEPFQNRGVLVTLLLVSGLLALVYYSGYWSLIAEQWQRVLAPVPCP